MEMTGKLGRLGLASAALVLVTGVSALIGTPANAQAPTSLPMARFYGQVTQAGLGAPIVNEAVTATIGNTVCSGTQSGNQGTGSSYTSNNGSYFLDVQAVSGCTTPGATIVFTMGGMRAKETGTVPQIPGTPVHLDLDFQLPATPAATPPPPPPARTSPTPAPPPPPAASTPRPVAATPAPKPVVQQAPAGVGGKEAPVYAGPVSGARLPNTGTGGLLDQQTAETDWALLVIVLAALGVSATGLVAYRRQR